MSNPKSKSKLGQYLKVDSHDEELWLISYADMMTLLFGFFVILFSFSTIEDKKFEQMTEKVAEAFQAKDSKSAPKSLAGSSGEERNMRAMQMLIGMLNLGDNMDKAVEKIEQAYSQSQNMASAKNILQGKIAANPNEYAPESEVKGDSRTVELVLPDATLFDRGSFDLHPEAQGKLKNLATDLLQLPELVQIEVSGHTDSRSPGAKSQFQNNFTLSSLRAGAVADVLLRAGIRQENLIVRGMGSLQPILPERDREGREIPENMAKNRRVTILLKMKERRDPLVH